MVIATVIVIATVVSSSSSSSSSSFSSFSSSSSSSSFSSFSSSSSSSSSSQHWSFAIPAALWQIMLRRNPYNWFLFPIWFSIRENHFRNPRKLTKYFFWECGTGSVPFGLRKNNWRFGSCPFGLRNNWRFGSCRFLAYRFLNGSVPGSRFVS